jgi:hypothetical protein
VPLPVGLCVKLTVDDPQPLNEAVSELQGLCVGLRVAQALAVKELVAHAEWEPDAQPLTVPLPVGLVVKLTVRLGERVNEGHGEVDPLRVCAKEALTLAEPDTVGEPKGVTEKDAEAVVVTVCVAHGEPEPVAGARLGEA